VQLIDQGLVDCREVRDGVLVEKVSLPLDFIGEFGEMVRGPTCHSVLKLGFEVSEVRRICAILTRQDRSVMHGRRGKCWRSLGPVRRVGAGTGAGLTVSRGGGTGAIVHSI